VCSQCNVVALVLKSYTQAIFTSTDVVQVNITAETGDMGILANHVPSIEPLRPGVVEVIDSSNASKKWFGEEHTQAYLFP
jgi:F0F1-type ATP synthase epsilon subunit